jgi:hypothetical protein
VEVLTDEDVAQLVDALEQRGYVVLTRRRWRSVVAAFAVLAICIALANKDAQARSHDNAVHVYNECRGTAKAVDVLRHIVDYIGTPNPSLDPATNTAKVGFARGVGPLIPTLDCKRLKP